MRGIGSAIFAILEKVEKLKILKTVIAAGIGLAGFSGALANELINSPAYSPIAQATKNGTRFVADISSTDGNNIDQPTGGFIDSIYLHVELDRLIGQPTEFYGLKWTMGDRVDIPLSSGKVISQFALSQLDKYPDLKARFADLRPVDLKLSYKFGLGFNDSMNGLVNQTQGLQTPHFYTAQNHADGKKVISRSPHLIIMGSGQQGTDFIPSSPRDWASFASWEYGLATNAGQDTNLAAQNTFEQATQMWLSNLKVESVKLPTSQMSAIYEEFQKREKAEEDKAKADAENKRTEQIAKSAEAKLAAKMKQIEAEKAAEAKLAAKIKELSETKIAEARLAKPITEPPKPSAVKAKSKFSKPTFDGKYFVSGINSAGKAQDWTYQMRADGVNEYLSPSILAGTSAGDVIYYKDRPSYGEVICYGEYEDARCFKVDSIQFSTDNVITSTVIITEHRRRKASTRWRRIGG